MSFETVSISVVVARKENKFVVTDEKWGWYLPAGRVDFGESFTTAGVREAQEEAGFTAVLDGIMRFEYSIGKKGFVRFRAILAAHQDDESKPLKLIADHETYGADWFTLDEVKALRKEEKWIIDKIRSSPRRVAQKKKKVKRKFPDERMRGSEIIHLFTWAESGTNVFSLDLYRGTDGRQINNKKVTVNTRFYVQVIVENVATGNVTVEKVHLKQIDEFTPFAESVCERIGEKLGASQSAQVELKGICGIFHEAPQTKKDEGSMCIIYWATTSLDDETKAGVAFSAVDHANDWDESGKMGLQNHRNGNMAPLEFLAWEGSKYYPI